MTLEQIAGAGTTDGCDDGRPAETETFGQRLARLRKARGYTQTELGEQLGRDAAGGHLLGEPGPVAAGALLPRVWRRSSASPRGAAGTAPAPGPPAPRHTRLWRKLREAEQLPEADRKAVLRFIDALLARQRLRGAARLIRRCSRRSPGRPSGPGAWRAACGPRRRCRSKPRPLHAA